MDQINLAANQLHKQEQLRTKLQKQNSKPGLLQNSGETIMRLSIFISFLILITFRTYAQEKQAQLPKDTLIKAAREIITGSPYCALITIDSKGLPQVRTMNPFPLGDEIIIWFATSRKSRKVGEIKKNPNVCVYYSNHTAAKGYVTINGKAEIIDNKELLLKMKRDYWNGIPNWQENFVLIKITPKSMDVINYEKGVNSTSDTNRSPSVEF
jgi:general stress protein 26